MDKLNKVQNNNLPWKFFLLTFAFSWIVWLPGVLATKGIISLPLPYILLVGLGSFGPLVASFTLSFQEEGKKGIHRLFKKAVRCSFRKIWLIPTFLTFPILIGGSFLLYIIVNGVNGIPELQLLSQPWMILPVFIAAFFILGAVQEEFGWRGYALERLQKKWNPLFSSLILGGIWAIWHLPLFFIEGTGQSRIPFLLFFIGTFSISIIYTWLYNGAGNSLLIALLLHAMHNTSYNLFPLTLLPKSNQAFLYLAILQTIAAFIVVWKVDFMIKGLPQEVGVGSIE